MPRRTTLQDIAQKTGFHVTTVSLALRGSPNLADKTKAQIRRVAEALGYQPDPMLTALSAYRTNRRAPTFQAAIAWINNYPIRTDETFGVFYRPALRRANELGYKLIEFWANDPALQGARLSRVLKARGIRGVLFPPQPQPNGEFTLDWENFAAVTIGYTLRKPQLHLVINHQYQSMRQVLGQLRALGYRRIGLVLSSETDNRVNGNWSAAYLREQYAQPPRFRLNPFIVPPPLEELAFRRWLRLQRPDVVVTYDWKVLDWLEKARYKVPDDIGVAHLHLPATGHQVSGIHQNEPTIGLAVVDFLVSMLHRNECGVPAVPQHLLIESTWLPGHTLRPAR